MTRLIVTLGFLNEEEYQDYQSVMTKIELNGEAFLLEAEGIDSYEPENNLDSLEAYCARWEMKAEESNIPIVFDDSIDDFRYELELEIELGKVEEEKTMKRCEN